MTGWGEGADLADRITEEVQHSDYRLRGDGGQPALLAEGVADLGGTMPKARRAGKRQAGSRAVASATMGLVALSPDAGMSLMSDAATPARVPAQNRLSQSQKAASRRYVSRITRNTLERAERERLALADNEAIRNAQLDG